LDGGGVELQCCRVDAVPVDDGATDSLQVPRLPLHPAVLSVLPSPSLRTPTSPTNACNTSSSLPYVFCHSLLFLSLALVTPSAALCARAGVPMATPPHRDL
jgi:hypothetical protein